MMSIPDGIRIVGSGMSNTIVTQSAYSAGTINDLSVFHNSDPRSSFYISDLTIDCGWPTLAGSVKKAGAIDVSSSDVTIERVRAINFGSAGLPPAIDPGQASAECFVISAATPTNSGGSITIQNCIVEGAHQGGAYGYASCIKGCSIPGSIAQTNSNIIIRNNHVVGTIRSVALQFAGANVLIEGNEVSGAIQGINQDTWGGKCVSIINNKFVDVGLGIGMGTTYNQGNISTNWVMPFESVLITDNSILLSDFYILNSAGGSYAGGYYLPTGFRFGGNVQNLLVANNSVRIMPDLRGATNSSWYFVDIADFVSGYTNSNISLTGNSIEPGMQSFFDSVHLGDDRRAMVYENDNHYFDGTAVSLFPYFGYTFSDGLTDYTISPAPGDHEFTPSIRFSLPTSSGAATGTRVVHLPDPAAYSGRSYKIIFNKIATTANVGFAIQADANGWGGAFTNQVIIDIPTGTTKAIGSPLTLYSPGTAAVTNVVTITSIGGGWMVQR